MLLEFSVDNFLSFDNRTTLTMIPSIQNGSNTIQVKGVKILKSAAIYGANASGKSNFIKAFSVMEKILHNGLDQSMKNLYCRLDRKNQEKNTEFSITYCIKEKFYNFNFVVNLFHSRIISESLQTLNPKTDKTTIIYTLDKGDPDVDHVFSSLKIDDFDKNRLATYLFDNSKETDRLLITTLMEKEWKNHKLGFIDDFETWHESININMADRPIDNMMYLYDDDERKKVSEILAELNTGVSDVRFIEIGVDQFTEETEKSFADKTLQTVKRKFDQLSKNKAKQGELVLVVRGDAYYRISMSHKDGLKIRTIRLIHQNCSDMFNFGDESDGTKRLFDLLDIVFTSQENSVYVIDEIERSLHPVLTHKLIEILNERSNERNIQLIFTTHETHIMDLKLFRKDEIWFMEKDTSGSSRLYSLDIFKIRNETIIKNGYINGIYGGVPLLKKMEDHKNATNS